MTTTAIRRRGDDIAPDTRLMLRAARLYYRLDLTQDQVGQRLGISRYKVGRLLDRAVREDAVRIEIVHPADRLVALEDGLVERFGLRGAIVVDVPQMGIAAEDEQLARERVAVAAAQQLESLHPTGAIGVSWGRTMLELAGRLRAGWTQATDIVQLNGAISRSARPTRAQDVAERFGATTGGAIHLMAAPAIVGSGELRRDLEADPAIATTLTAAREAGTAIFGMGVLGADCAHVTSGCIDAGEVAALAAAGGVGDVLGRFLTVDGAIAMPALDERTVGMPLADLRTKPLSIGVVAGAGRGPIALGALRAGCVKVLVADEATAAWVLARG